ncbi:MAG: hypothetical protein RL153_1977, partial [Verrucomicrobiota bacterium]
MNQLFSRRAWMWATTACAALLLGSTGCVSLNGAGADQPPAGFTALFNGTDLTGWVGGDTHDYRKLMSMPQAERDALLGKWTASMTEVNPKTGKPHWYAENGELVNDGFGAYASTAKAYGDFELLVEYKT